MSLKTPKAVFSTSERKYTAAGGDFKQNRRQKVFNRGALLFCGEALGLCGGGLTLKKLTKTQLIYSVSCFNLGVLELRLEG